MKPSDQIIPSLPSPYSALQQAKGEVEVREGLYRILKLQPVGGAASALFLDMKSKCQPCFLDQGGAAREDVGLAGGRESQVSSVAHHI